MADRDTYRYTMRDGNKIIKFGITDNPERREAENRAAGLGDTLRIEGPRVKNETARDWEEGKIDAFAEREGHKPRGNK